MNWYTVLQAHPIMATIGPFTLYTHGLFFALGAEIGLWVLSSYAKQTTLNRSDLFFNGVVIFLAGLIGARLGFFLLYSDTFSTVGELFAIWQGGLLSFTGIAAGMAAALWLYKDERLRWLDGISIATLAAWSVGRLGNYYAADSVGVTSPFWSAFYGRVPIQLFESIACAILAVIGWHLFKTNTKKPGLIFKVSLAGYFLSRFIIDIWRDEARLGPLHLSQWVCLGVLLLIWRYRKYE